MSSLTENYDIKDLYVISFKKALMDSIEMFDESINYFKPDLFYIVEKFSNSESEAKHFEIYRECIAGVDFYKREGENEFLAIPNIFKTMEPLPLEYLDEEEILEGKISTTRIFQIFQEINFKKVKRLGKRR